MSLTLVGAATASNSFGQVRRIRGVTGIAVAVLAIFVLMALVGPWLAPHQPNQVDLASVFASPSWSHPLGADASGRDLLSRILTGSRTAMIGPILLVSVSTIAGVGLALIAAWYGGVVDAVISRFLDVTLAFPGLLIAIVSASVFGASLVTASLALSIAYVPYIGRVVRAEAMRERQLPYVQAAWLQGMSARRICLSQILRSLMPMVVAQVVLSISFAVIDLAAISYLGLGVQPPTADWGTMVASGQGSVLQGFPEETIAASACIVILVMALGVLGDALSERAERQ